MLCTQDINTDNKNSKLKPLAVYFQNHKAFDKQIVDAFLDGYKQASIAQYLNVSSTSISRRIRRYFDKQELFFQTKQKGLFWSYDNKLEYSQTLDTIIIETNLKYGDFADLKKLFLLYGKRVVKKVWKEKLIGDARFSKLNYFLARIFFGMNIEADYFKGGISGREKKLRMLAS